MKIDMRVLTIPYLSEEGNYQITFRPGLLKTPHFIGFGYRAIEPDQTSITLMTSIKKCDFVKHRQQDYESFVY
jgi:hypothetical protein